MQVGSTRAPSPDPCSLRSWSSTPTARAERKKDSQSRAPGEPATSPTSAAVERRSGVLRRVRYWQPAEYEARTTYTAALDAAAGLASGEPATPRCDSGRPAAGRTGGSTPRWSRSGWRGSATSGWGTTPSTTGTWSTDDTPFLFRVRRIRYGGEAEVTRRIRGPFQVALQGRHRAGALHHAAGALGCSSRISGTGWSRTTFGAAGADLRHPGQRVQHPSGAARGGGHAGRERRRRLHPAVRHPAGIPTSCAKAPWWRPGWRAPAWAAPPR